MILGIRQPTFLVYIGPPNSKHKLSVSLFIEQLPALFEYCNTLGGSVMILGDFNFHLTVLMIHMYQRFLTYFMFIIWSNWFMFLLINKVIYLTGLCMDQITFCCQAVTNKLTFNHLAILCNVYLTIPEPTTVQRLRRNIISIDMHQFSLDLKSKLDFVGNPSAEQFHCCLRSILDNHAPLSLAIVRQHKYSPWYCEICAELQAAKRIRCKAERRWLSSKLTVYK